MNAITKVCFFFFLLLGFAVEFDVFRVPGRYGRTPFVGGISCKGEFLGMSLSVRVLSTEEELL